MARAGVAAAEAAILAVAVLNGALYWIGHAVVYWRAIEVLIG